MGNKTLSEDSRFLADILRHHPERAGCALDPEGWADIGTICANTRLTRERIGEIVASGTRYGISDDGLMIRAYHGHSVPVDYGEPVEPPEILYHGTSERGYGGILSSGAILPMGRRMVHLSVSAERASDVGSRRGEPVILEVDAGRMHRDGLGLYLSADGVYLTEKVPAEYVRRAD